MNSYIAFFANTINNTALTVRNNAMNIAAQLGYRCLEINDIAQIGRAEIKDVLFLAVIGGDGTILKVAPPSAEHHIPILGINTGRLGFLSEIQPQEFEKALKIIAAGNHTYDERMMLSCAINDENVSVSLNEVFLYRETANTGIAHIGVTIDDLEAGIVSCDGIIISTTTGSTGYSISAGGPVLAPGFDACIITPVCPHTLTAKPIVASPDAVINFVMHSAGALYADGRKIKNLGINDHISIKRADITLRFVRLWRNNIYKLIREKLI